MRLSDTMGVPTTLVCDVSRNSSAPNMWDGDLYHSRGPPIFPPAESRRKGAPGGICQPATAWKVWDGMWDAGGESRRMGFHNAACGIVFGRGGLRCTGLVRVRACGFLRRASGGGIDVHVSLRYALIASVAAGLHCPVPPPFSRLPCALGRPASVGISRDARRPLPCGSSAHLWSPADWPPSFRGCSSNAIAMVVPVWRWEVALVAP